MKINVGFLVSYDYKLLVNAIPCVYDEADAIFLAIDINRKTWSGSNIVIAASFFGWVKGCDRVNEILF